MNLGVPLPQERLSQDWQELLRSTVDSLTAHIAVLDAEGTIIMVNEAWCSFGEANGNVQPNFGLGVNYLSVCESAVGLAEDNIPEVLAGLKQVCRGEQPSFLLTYPCHSPSERRWFTMRVNRISGSGAGQVVVAHESITSVVEPMEKLKLLADVTEASPASIMVISLDGTIVYVNQIFTESSGYSAEELIGQTILSVGLMSEQSFNDRLTSLKDGGIWQGELRSKRKTGEIYWETAMISPLRDSSGAITHVVRISRDITELKRRHHQFERDFHLLETSNLEIHKARRAALSMMQDANLQRKRAVSAITELKASQSALAKQHEQLKAILDIAPPVTISRDGIIHYINSAAERSFGLQKGDQISPTFVNDQDHWEIMLDLSAAKTVHLRQVKAYDASGGILELLVSAQIKDYQDQPSIYTFYVDVTSLNQAEKRLVTLSDRLQLATQAATIGIWDWDLMHDILEWDDTMYQLFGQTPGASTVEMWEAALHPDDRDRVMAESQAALDGMPDYTTSFRIIWPDARVRHIKAHTVIQRDAAGKPVRTIGINMDTTEEWENEEALRRAKEDAEKANKSKSAFLANMSHEIRTPMNAILGYAEMLQRDDTLSPAHHQQIEIIHRSGQHLLTLINDILEMSKVEAGRVEVNARSFDLVNLLKDIEQMFRVQTDAKGLDFTVQLDDQDRRHFEADDIKIRQVIINLLSNAVKFTTAGSIQLQVSSKPVANDSWEVVIHVEDSGIGIKPDFLEQIFDVFEQAKNGAIGGTGLGMAISRNFARLMGGDVTVASVFGQGSRFTFTFKAKTGDKAHPTDVKARIPLSLVASEMGKKVLIVDDIATNRDLLADLLQPIGFAVRLVATGEEAIREHDVWQPDLILMDLRMPGIDGLETSRRLRAKASQVPIIVISASSFQADHHKALAAGANHFLSKPISEAELFFQLQHLLAVTYVYPPSTAGMDAMVMSSGDPEALQQALAQVPAALLAELRDAVVRARSDQMKEVIQLIAEQAPEAAQYMRQLSQEFQYDTLLSVLGHKEEA